MKHRLAVIVPTYGCFEYAAKTVDSALRNTMTTEPVIVLIDDASPEWRNNRIPDALALAIKDVPESQIYIERFQENGGLTRSWNRGLCAARRLDCVYACCANSDLIFSPGWDAPLVNALDVQNMSLVGPVTNAPGSELNQMVGRYLSTYRVDDDVAQISATAASLAAGYGFECVESTINGFCMLATVNTWFENAFAPDVVFCPLNHFNSKGVRNKTPGMTLNEYELQGRWHAKHLRTGFCPGSFVFHYRSVSRGTGFSKGQHFRMRN